MTDELVKRLRGWRGFHQANLSIEAADRIEQLAAERDEAINQLDSAIHSVIVLEKRVAAVMEDRRFILEERDRTFAVMLARAEKAEAEADNARLQKALTDAGAYLDKGQDKMAFNVIRAALKG